MMSPLPFRRLLAQRTTEPATVRSAAVSLLDLWRSKNESFDVALGAAMDLHGDTMLGLLYDLAGDDRFSVFYDVVSLLTDRYLFVEDHAGDRAGFRQVFFAVPVWGARGEIDAFLASSGQDLLARAISEGGLFGPLASVVLVPEAQHLFSLFPDKLAPLSNLVDAGTSVALGEDAPQAWTRAAASLLAGEEPSVDEASPELAAEGDRCGPVFRLLFGLAGILMPPGAPEDGPDFLTGYAGEDPAADAALSRIWARIAGNVRRRFAVNLGRPASFVSAQDTAAAAYARFVVEMIVVAERAFEPPSAVSLHACEEDERIVCALVVEDDLVGTFMVDAWLVPDQEVFVAELEKSCEVIWHEDIDTMPTPEA